MNKTEALKKELEKLGIHNEADLREAMKGLTVNISLMASVPVHERGVA